MRTITLCIILGLILFALTQPYGWACTTFQLNHEGRIFVEQIMIGVSLMADNYQSQRPFKNGHALL